VRHRDLKLILAGGVVLLAADLAAWVAWHLAPLLLVAGGGWLAWRWHRRHNLPSRARIVTARPDRRAVANGWAPPARQQLVQVSAPCADGEHVWCHTPICQCQCGHPSRDFPERPPF
jgi:hypothetical protein